MVIFEFISTFSFSLHKKRNTSLSHICFSNIRARPGVIKSSVMKGIVLIVFDGNISFFVSLSKSPEVKYTKSNADLLSSSVVVFYQSVKIEKFLHSMYFSVCERETGLLFFLMNLLKGPEIFAI